MRLALTFKEFRKDRGMTQKELALIVGVKDNYIWMIENGRRVPSLNLCFKIGDVFGASKGWVHSMWFNAVRVDHGRWREKSYETVRDPR